VAAPHPSFLLPPPPPTSTLFPYTTLFRSVRDDRQRLAARRVDVTRRGLEHLPPPRAHRDRRPIARQPHRRRPSDARRSAGDGHDAHVTSLHAYREALSRAGPLPLSPLA